MKGLRFTKIVKQLKVEGVWGEWEAKHCSQRQPWTKYLRQTLLFLWNSALREKVNFYFSGVFLLVLKKFSVREEDRTLDYHSMKFWGFPDVFKFLKIVSLKLFGKLWGDSYIPCLLWITALRLTFGKRKTWQNI